MWYTQLMDVTTLAAIAEANRMRIVEALRERPHTVNELVERLQMRQPQVSKHLKVLSDAGVVLVQPVANQRIYRLNGAPFVELAQWVEQFREAVDERYGALDALLDEMKREEQSQERDE